MSSSNTRKIEKNTEEYERKIKFLCDYVVQLICFKIRKSVKCNAVYARTAYAVINLLSDVPAPPEWPRYVCCFLLVEKFSSDNNLLVLLRFTIPDFFFVHCRNVNRSTGWQLASLSCETNW